MSKLESISRYLFIINKLRKRPATFKEISEYLQRESELQEREFNISERTFLRDRKEIFSIFSIEISFNRRSKKYELTENENSGNSLRLLETLDLFNALNLSERMQEYIHFEDRKPQGTEHIQFLVQTIRNNKLLSFTHQKFWEQKTTQRKVEPYLVKENKNR